jgi:hypothetical protein
MAFDNDDRKSFRANIVDRLEGTLLFGDARIQVCVLDQSATGFKLSTDDQRPIPSMIDAVLNLVDGVQHTVQIRHVERVEGNQTLGIKRLATRLRPLDEPRSAVAARRMSLAKVLVVLLFIAVSAFALQAAPVRNRIAQFSLFDAPKGNKVTTDSAAPSSRVATVPVLDRRSPIELRRHLADADADWLELAEVQRRLLRSLADICGETRTKRREPAQAAAVEFATTVSMLEILNTEQRSRLESKFDRPLSGSALLRDTIEHYLPDASPRRLFEQFGALATVSPTIAAHYDVSEEVVAALCKQVDEAFQPIVKVSPRELDGVDADQIVGECSLRMKKLEANCRKLLIAMPAKSGQ